MNGNGFKWGWPAAMAFIGAIGVTMTIAGFYRGERIGREAKVAAAAVDQKRLTDVEVQAQATADRMGERMLVDTAQEQRLVALERQHEETLVEVRDLAKEVHDLVQVMWKDEIRRQERSR